MHDHACLADRESKKDPDCIGRNQEGDECARCEKEDHSADSNRQNSTSVREPIAALPNLTRQKSVSSQDSRKLWPTVKSGVGCKKQDASGCNLIDNIEDSISEGGSSNLRHQRFATNLLRDLAKRKCKQRDAKEDCREQNRHDAHCVRRILRLRLLEGRNAI